MSVMRSFQIGETVTRGGESYCDIVFEAEDNNVIIVEVRPTGAGGRKEIGVVIIPTDAPTARSITCTKSDALSGPTDVLLVSVGDNEDAPEDLIALRGRPIRMES